MGWGAEVFTALTEGSGWWRLLLGGGLFALLVLYVLDVSYWTGAWRHLQRLGVGGGHWKGVVLLLLRVRVRARKRSPKVVYAVRLYRPSVGFEIFAVSTKNIQD